MSASCYTIRYRSTLYRDKASLIVEDDGKRFHVTCHPDHCTLAPLPDASVSEDDLTRLGWQRVVAVAPYPLDLIRSLLKGAVITHHLPPALTGTVHAA